MISTTRAGLEQRVTADTLRDTAAIWLRQDLGDTRLVAEYLGHADLSTVSRYAHVAREELFAAAERQGAKSTRNDLTPRLRAWVASRLGWRCWRSVSPAGSASGW